MFLVYKPSENGEPAHWRYNPLKLMSAEREDIERRTGRNYSAFTQDVLSGNSLCRRALLYVFLKREHPTTRFEDVDFAWDELTLEFSKGELEQMREKLSETMSGEDLTSALAAIDREIEGAPEDDGPGKASLPIAA